MRRAFVFGLAGALLSSAALAEDIRTETVRFPPGASQVSIEGSIRGDHSARYRVAMEEGQRLQVRLKTSNASNYFNVTAAGAQEAHFNGALSGNSASLTAASAGDQIIDVYLMRNAARRNEAADYSLTIAVR